MRHDRDGSPSKKGQGFQQPLKPHEHWHTDISYINICGNLAGIRPRSKNLTHTRHLWHLDDCRVKRRQALLGSNLSRDSPVGLIEPMGRVLG